MSMLKQKGVELRKYIARKGLFVRVPIPLSLKALEPEISLGRAILDRAILDSLEKPQDDFFDLSNEHFHTICYISYLDPEETFKRATLTIQRLQEKQLISNILENIEVCQKTTQKTDAQRKN